MMPPRPVADLRVKPKTVQQEIVEKLRNAIVSGMFHPGDRLVEAELCASLGVSRASLREALRSLEAERLIEMMPNKGPHIPVLTWEDAKNIYDVRQILEGEAAALCAESISASELAELRKALQEFEEAVKAEDAVARVAAADSFHEVIFSSCNNPIISDLIGSLRARISFLRARSMAQIGRAENSLEEMKSILTAIASRQPEAARRAVRHHIVQASATAKSTYSSTCQSV